MVLKLGKQGVKLEIDSINITGCQGINFFSSRIFS